MFFKKRTSANDLAAELIGYSAHLGHSTMTTILRASDKTDAASVASANTHVDDFCTLWPVATCIAGQRYKTGDASRLCGVALTMVRHNHPQAGEMISKASALIDECHNTDGRFGLITAKLFQSVCPEVEIKERAVPGANFITCMNYADHLASGHRIDW